jgi:membrane-associated protease RseP (regulator of RpoE activity)
MQVIPFNRKPTGVRGTLVESARVPGPRKGGVVLLLAATLAAGAGTALAEQVEKDDVAKPAPPMPPAGAASPAPAPAPMPPKASAKSQSDRDRDARLEDAKKRLEAAAAEVAALSSEIATQAMQKFSTFAGGPRRSIIGVVIEAVDGGTGARVRDVSPGGAAEAAGIRVGDVIVAVNGTTLKYGAREAVNLLRQVEPESTVQLRVMRDGKPKDFKVTVRRWDDSSTFVYTPPDVDFDFNFDFDPSQGPFHGFGPSVFHGALAGMEVTTLTPQLARYFGADSGLLVVRAPKDDVYKLQDGDVILNIDGRIPTNGSHVTRILRSYQPGEKLTLRIMRDRKPMDLQVTLPEDNRSRRTRATRVRTDSTPL